MNKQTLYSKLYANKQQFNVKKDVKFLLNTKKSL